MSVITISRASCSNGQLIAEQAAVRLGYECISREILLETSDVFNVPEIQLARAIHDGPSFFDRITHGKEKYLAYIRATLLNHIRRDNVVYHGLAGHFFLQGISHVLKVRIVTDYDSRVEQEMQREHTTISLARKRLLKDDSERRKWSRSIYGKDTSDPDLYDLVLNLKHVSVDDCVNIICNTVAQSSFQTNPESLKKLEDLTMEANAKALLVDRYSDATVAADDGNLTISIAKRVPDRNKVVTNIESLLSYLSGIKNIDVHVQEEVTPSSLMYMGNRRQRL